MTKNHIYKILVTILLLLQVYFFDVVPHLNQLLTNWNTDVSKKLEVIVLICILSVRVLPSRNVRNIKSRMIKDSKSHFNFFSVIILVGIIAVAWGSSVTYSQTFWKGISGFYGFLIIPLGYFALKPFFKKITNIKWFYKMCSLYCAMYLVMQFLQALIYKITGIVFLQYTQSASLNLLTLGRFTEAIDFITFVSIFISIKPFLFKKKWNKFDITLLIAIIIYHLFVSKGRMDFLVTSVAFGLALLFLFKGIFREFIIVLISGGIIYKLPKIIEGVFEIFTNGSRSSSYTIRIYGIDYYFNHIFTNGWFGIGFPDKNQYNWLLHGTAGYDVGAGLLNYVDLGLLGTSSILGVVGFVIIIYLLVLMVLALVIGRNKKVLFILNATLFTEFFTLSPFDMQRAWLFSIILLLIDFSWENKASAENEK